MLIARPLDGDATRAWSRDRVPDGADLGGVLGLALLAAVFATRGSLATSRMIVDRLRPALLIAATALGMGAIAAFGIPVHQRWPRRAKRSR
jgi:hypothetical protein